MQLIQLPQADSTNLWAKQNIERLLPAGVVWTTDQTAGRGRLGRDWTNSPGDGLFLSAVVSGPFAQPATLPLFAALAVQRAITGEFGPLDLQVKWPNDLILNGKKLVGILCEGTARGLVCGIGTNLRQDRAYFDRLDLPHGTSLALEGLPVDDGTAARLAARYAAHLTGPDADRWKAEGLAPFLAEYRACCVNLGRTVTFDGGSGTCVQIDEEGRLILATDSGEQCVFTGEVSVKGIYEQLSAR